MNLTQKIKQRILTKGDLPFSELMNLALSDEEFGYYTTRQHPIGKQGDFYTSSHISAHFGELLAEFAVRTWKDLGSPAQFVLVEVGGGEGYLASDLLTALQRNHLRLFETVRVVMCEPSPLLQVAQQARLREFSSRVTWSDLSRLAGSPITGLVVANEVVDALPVHRLRYWQGQLEESFVTVHHNLLALRWKKPSNPTAFSDYLDKTGMSVPEGYQFEIGLKAITWLTEVAKALARGTLLTIDYGDLSDHLAVEPNGTLRCFYRHMVNSDFLERLGEQDITADVNFSALMAYGLELGLKPVKLDRQGDFLIGLGLLEQLEKITDLEQTSPAALKERLALKHFLVPGGMGDHFKVLIQKKS